MGVRPQVAEGGALPRRPASGQHGILTCVVRALLEYVAINRLFRRHQRLYLVKKNAHCQVPRVFFVRAHNKPRNPGDPHNLILASPLDLHSPQFAPFYDTANKVSTRVRFGSLFPGLRRSRPLSL